MACQKAAPPLVNPRVVVLQFENQSGDAALQTTALMASETARMRLAADPQRSPVLARSQEDVRQSGAGLALTGTLRRSAAKLRIEAHWIDAATGARLDSFTCEGNDPAETALRASDQFTKKLLGAAGKPLPGSAEAWRALSEASLQPSTESLSAVTTRFPDFGPAYVTLLEWLNRRGQPGEVQALLGRIPPKLDPESSARLALSSATEPAARVAALRRVVELRATDPALRLDLASLLQRQGDWKSATVEYLALTRLEPNNGEAFNMLGYAYAQQGQVQPAVQALAQYARLAPNEANPLDSLGEVYYMNRKFAEAAKQFDLLGQRFPAFSGSSAWRKAAFAYWKAGDKKTADARFENWVRTALAQAAPHTVAFQRAAWLAHTGRWAKEGKTLMDGEISGSSGERRVAAEMYLALFRFALEGKAPESAAFSPWAAQLKDPALRNSLSVFAFVAQPVKDEPSLRALATAATARPELAPLRESLIEASLRAHRKIVAVRQPLQPLPNNIETPLSVFSIPAIP
jgi:Flp pilus assembly protein TadD